MTCPLKWFKLNENFILILIKLLIKLLIKFLNYFEK